MTELAIKKFNFKSTITEAEIQAAAPQQVSKFLEPGKYDVKITEASLNITESNPTGRSKGDASWLVVKVRLAVATGASILTYILVPTEDLTYKKPGMDPKYKFLMANKFKEFLRSIGENPSVDNIGNVLEKLFSNPANLVGKTAKISVGYQGNYLQYAQDSKTYTIVNKKGEPVIKRQYADRDAAQAEAAELGIEIQKFPEVRKFT